MNLKEIEDFYPLSPMQQGMFFHSLYAPEIRAYVNTLSNAMQGSLNVEAFQRAWQKVVDRHTILRTAFVNEGLKQPLQFVYREATLPWMVHDWRALDAAEQQEQLESFLVADRSKGFDLTAPPLMRFALLRMADEQWQFVWSFHHILLDGWCLSLLLQEVFRYYDAYSRGEQFDLPRARPYRDYIGWLKARNMAEAEAYWRKRLAGFTAPTPLGIGVPASSLHTTSHSYAEQQSLLSEETTSKLDALARQQQVTLNTVIQGAWGFLLSRYSQDDDVLFGTIVSGRPAELAGVEQMVGLFINNLPVRVKTPPDAKLGEWLQQLQREQIEMRQYEYSPLVDVQGWSGVDRGVPLFESLLAYESSVVMDRATGNGSDSATDKLSVTQGRSLERTNYPIAFVVGPGARLTMRVMYEEDRFEHREISRMLQHFERLLESMANGAEQRLSDLRYLTVEEEQQQLVEWNDSAVAAERTGCIHKLIEEQVAKTPDAIAIVDGARAVSYEELNHRANQVAHHLLSQGARPNMLIGICVERSVEMFVGLLAILKTGAAYVPLDPKYPQGRLTLMLEEAQVEVLLTQSKLALSPPESCKRVVYVDTDFESSNTVNPDVSVTDADLAYVIYTSGSTGQPKGAGVYHRGIVNLFDWFIREFEITERDRVLLVTSLSFDLTQKNLFAPLMVGATIHLAPSDHYDARAIADLISEKEITLLNCTPSAFYPLVDNDDYDSLIKLTSLRYLFLGGEPISVPRLSSWMEFYDSNTVVVNTYGPTECSDIAAFHRLDPDKTGDYVVPIGKPVFNSQLFILGKDLELLPAGIVGELCISGTGVGAGYINDNSLTTAKFIPHPFSNDPGSRLYRTGDLARFLPNGDVEFLGRSDHQVKIRGFRIEIGEIETALREHISLRDVVVVARDAGADDKQLVAYFVADDERVPPSVLRDHLAARVPDYMIPSLFVQLDELPLTPNGKVDRRSLPSPDEVQPEEVEGEVAKSRNPIEEIVAGIWSEVLGVKKLGIHDNFFELGGHSLYATQVISRICDTFDIELPFRLFFEAPTVAGLAVQVDSFLSKRDGLEVPPLVPVGRDEDLPLSFAQQRLWFLDQLDPDSPTYNVPAVIRLHGPFELRFFQQAVAEVISRHESLRTCFRSEDGVARQVIVQTADLQVPLLDLTDYPDGEQEAAVKHICVQEARQPFDLSNGPLLRVRLLVLGHDRHVLLMTMHHIVSDGWSMSVLMRELIVLYDAYRNGRPSPLPPLAIQYADYAAWQRQWLQGAALEEHLAYWRKQLSGAPPVLELPTDHPRPAVQTFAGAMIKRRLEAGLLPQLESLSRREGLTLYMLLLAAFKLVLARYSQQSEIVVGTPIAGRTRSEIEGLIGFFVNTLVLRTQVAEQRTVRELLAQVRDVCLGGYTHQQAPFEQLVEELQPERDLSHQSLFQVMFALEGGGDEAPWRIGKMEVSFEETESEVAKFDLTLRVKQGTEGLETAIEYKRDLFEAATIERMLGHIEQALKAIAKDVKQKVGDVELLSDAERTQVVVEWNRTSKSYEPGGCIHQLIERQAALRPDAIAVICEGEQLSYGELNGRANQLARQLTSLGVGPESLVGICVEKSPEMIVGLLGILKAGGAYVPLDPEYPRERLSFMLKDSAASVLLTSGRSIESDGIKVIDFDNDWQAISQNSDANVDQQVSGENIAYVIYTSGSTGMPKGVMLQHKGLVNRSLAMMDQYHLTADDRQLQFISLSFDASVEEIFSTLAAGAALVLYRNLKVLSPAELLSSCGENGVTKIDLPVSYWHQMVDEVSQSGREVPQSLRTIVAGGDVPSPEKLKAFARSAHDSLTVYNAYGPTEATVLACLYDMSQFDIAGAKVPIGRPIFNVTTYILDADFKPLPIGVPGEFYLGGEGLARGYLNRPELTAEKFVPDLFSADAGARLYRTGDLARYLPDGQIEFVGRVDQQVKVRGFRIELSEIENALISHGNVKDVVVAVQQKEGNKSLVAYVVKQADPPPTTVELRRHLQNRVPDYMVPSFFAVLDELPMTPSGKVDRKALPAVEVIQPHLESEYAAPETPVEELLANIWAKVLGVERIGIHDNFFEAGGDSILSIQAIARANQAGLRLSPKDLFQHQTVAKLAAVAGAARTIHAEQGTVTGEVELTPIQHWFLATQSIDKHHFNQALLLQVREPIAPEIMAEAGGHVVRHHDALRLRFREVESGWQQVHAPVDEEISFDVIDLTNVPLMEQSAAIEAEAGKIQASLSLTDGPMLRLVYFNLGSEQPARLMLVCHHLVVDGISWRILLEDLQTAYGQLAAGAPVRLPAKTTSFQHWARTLKEYAGAESVKAQAAYWNAPGRVAVSSIPRDKNDGENTISSLQAINVGLSAEETQALLQEVPAVYHTQISDVLLTAVALTLSKWTGSRRVLVDMEGHGREQISDAVDVSRTVGWFTTIYPVLLEVNGVNGRVGEVLKSVKEQLRQIPEQGIGYGLLRYLSDDAELRDSLAKLPQAEVSFNYLGQVDRVLDDESRFRPAPESSGQPRSPRGARQHLLEINSIVAGGKLQISWTYSDRVHHRETIEEVAHDYVQALQRIIRHCQSDEAGGYTPSDFPLANLDADKLDKLTLLLNEIDDSALAQI